MSYYDYEEKTLESDDNHNHEQYFCNADPLDPDDPNNDRDYVYDEEYGDCYRVYCIFECRRCKVAWISDNAWECYDEYGHPVTSFIVLYMFKFDH